MESNNTITEYQVMPYDYFVRDYFLAKSLVYVLHYIKDDILFDVAVDEAASKYRITRDDIIKHVKTIRFLNCST